MKNEGCFFRFGGMTFALYGAKPLTNTESLLAQFFVPSTAHPDVEIYAEKAEILPLPRHASLLHEAYGLRVFETETERFLCYRDTDKAEHREYAVVRCCKLHPETLYMTISEARYRFSAERLLSGMAIESLLLRHHRGILHAACIEYQGGAILFSGECGCGKSTQAALWKAQTGADIRNGDKTLLWCKPREILACGLPFAGTSGICTEFQLPVRVIVFPVHAAENRAERLTPAQAAKLLLSQLPVQVWSREDVQNALTLATELAQRISVYRLFCRPEEAAVTTLRAVI